MEYATIHYDAKISKTNPQSPKGWLITMNIISSRPQKIKVPEYFGESHIDASATEYTVAFSVDDELV